MKPILEVQHISKRYKIQHISGGYLSLRERLFNGFRFTKNSVENFWALNDVSLEVNPGECVGIIGRNGAGKSTLLKILSKITPPTNGRIITRGRIASLLEVGTGFHPELTGRENIFFNGSLLGMKRKEIQSRFDEIIDFSGTEKFLDTPLKHYSSGMQLRLAFSVAAFLEPEMLIIDEVLAVGDAEFQKKCLGKMEDVSKSGRTILFVSHNLISLKTLCSRGIVLDRGAKAFDGNMDEAVRNYLSMGTKERSRPRIADSKLHSGTGEIAVRDIEVLGNDNSTIIHTGDTIQVRLSYEIKNENFDFTSCHVGIIVYDQNQNVVISHTNRLIGIQFKDEDFKKGETIVFTIREFPLNKGSYSLSYNIVDQNKYLDSMENAIEFEIEEGLIYNYKKSDAGGIVAVRGLWEIQPAAQS
jgi:lipopolysaccharide transport system ATP-binding protein